MCPECGTALCGHETIREARCRREAGGLVDSAEWRHEVRQRLVEAVLPAADAARAATVFLGVEVSAARVRQWRRRGRLVPVDPDAARPLCRVAGLCEHVKGVAVAIAPGPRKRPEDSAHPRGPRHAA